MEQVTPFDRDWDTDLESVDGGIVAHHYKVSILQPILQILSFREVHGRVPQNSVRTRRRAYKVMVIDDSTEDDSADEKYDSSDWSAKDECSDSSANSSDL